MAQPSPRTIPSAPASNERQRPVGDKGSTFSTILVESGETMMLTPPTSARSQSPARSARHARCTATSDDEHAVSTAMLGPCTSRT